MAQHTPPKFFITHSWKDIEFTKRLCDDLRANGLDGFFDAYSIHPGDVISAEISRGLEACDIYVPILSRASLKSPWCEEEINAAITLGKLPDRNGRPRIIPVLVEDCQDALPIFLRSRLYINFAGRYGDALNELLSKGFGLPPRATTPPAPRLAPSPALPVSAPPSKRTNWLMPIGVLGTLGVLVVCIAAMAVILPPFLTPTAAPVAQTTSVFTPIIDATAPAAQPTSTPTQRPTASIVPSPSTATPFSIVERIIGAAQVPMVFVPEGEFLMGSSDDNINLTLAICPNCPRDKFDDEKPQHTVYLDAYWIDKYEVTNATYKVCVDSGQCVKPRTESSSHNPYYGNSRYDNYPVIYVSWTAAKTFCEWVGKRLPTEAEWEKAARGTDGRIYPWGNTFDGGKANYNALPPRSDDTTAVGAFPGGASPYGALDMAGNVWEWVLDMYDAKYYSNSPRNNPKGPSGEFRVMRGGGWGTPDYGIRVTTRQKATPSWQAEAIGFRCAQ